MDNILINELENLDILQVNKFSFNNYQTFIKVIKVIDGDTITAIFKYKDEFFKYNFRINNIDTAEIHSKDNNIKLKALEAKQFLFNLIFNKIIKAKFLNFDKYGRILVELFMNESDQLISDVLIEGGFAKKYNGGTKESWE